MFRQARLPGSFACYLSDNIPGFPEGRKILRFKAETPYVILVVIAFDKIVDSASRRIGIIGRKNPGKPAVQKIG
jgi:hypothetical protein